MSLRRPGQIYPVSHHWLYWELFWRQAESRRDLASRWRAFARRVDGWISP
jgi:hypothetical protein